MPRRFPVSLTKQHGFNGLPMRYLVCGLGLMLGIGVLARVLTADNKLEATKRHHPKSIGYTSLNKQMDLMREATQKITPNIDEHFYEYSRARRRILPKSN